MGKEENIKAESALEDARAELDRAKARLLETSDSFDPLSVIRDNPVMSAGSAFLLGFGLTSLSRKLALVQFVPLLLQTAETASRLVMTFRKN